MQPELDSESRTSPLGVLVEYGGGHKSVMKSSSTFAVRRRDVRYFGCINHSDFATSDKSYWEASKSETPANSVIWWGAIENDTSSYSSDALNAMSPRIRVLSDINKATPTDTVPDALAADFFLSGLKQFARDNAVIRGIDAILEYFNSTLLAGTWDVCDRILAASDPVWMPEEFVVALLGCTLPAKTRLKSRADFFDRCIRHYTDAHGSEIALEILSGLQ